MPGPASSCLPTIHSFRAPTLPGSPLMVSRNCSRKTSPASYPRPCSGEARYDQSFRDRRSHAGYRRGRGWRGNPGPFFLFRVRLQIAASRATISRDLMVRTVFRHYSAPKRLLRFAWLPFRHNARCVIFVVENKPLFHFAVAFRTLIVNFHHLPRSHYLGERPVAFNAGKLVAGTRRAFQPTTPLAGGKPKA